MDVEAFQVPIGGYDMQLRPSEVESVAAGLGLSPGTPLSNVVRAVALLPINDRAPAWELAIRRYGRGKPLEQAAGEIGLDVIWAQALMDAFTAS
jgi:hypothetical protein